MRKAAVNSQFQLTGTKIDCGGLFCVDSCKIYRAKN
jgi:hypothetical protein